jgi:hypothetical protein
VLDLLDVLGGGGIGGPLAAVDEPAGADADAGDDDPLYVVGRGCGGRCDLDGEAGAGAADDTEVDIAAAVMGGGR